MAVPSGRGMVGYIEKMEDLPKSAVPLSDEEVVSMQNTLIRKWQPQKEMFWIRFGTPMLASLASLSGAFYVHHLRNHLLLRKKARMATLVPALFIPFFSTVGLQTFGVTRKIRINSSVCPACMEIRATTLQLASAVVFPYLISLTSCVTAAKTFTTYALPPYTDIKSQFRLLTQMSRPLVGSVGSMCVVNILFAVVVTYFQFETVVKVNKALMSEKVFKS